MNDEKNLKDQQNRGALAMQILEHPLYQEAYIAIRARLLDEFTKTKFKDGAERDEIWRKMQTIDEINKWFESLISNGEFAKKTLLQKVSKINFNNSMR